MNPTNYENLLESLRSPGPRRLPLPQAPRIMPELYEEEEEWKEILPFPSSIPRMGSYLTTPLSESILNLPPRAQLLCLLIAYEMTMECTPGECWEEPNAVLMQNYAIRKLTLLRAYLDDEISDREYLQTVRQEFPDAEVQTIFYQASEPCQFLFRTGDIPHLVSPNSVGLLIEHTLRKCAPRRVAFSPNPNLKNVVAEWVARCRARLAVVDWEHLEMWSPESAQELIIYGLWDTEGTYGLPFIYADSEAEQINEEVMDEAIAKDPALQWAAPDLIVANVSLNELRDGVHEATLYSNPVELYLWSRGGGSHDRTGLLVVPNTRAAERAARDMKERAAHL